MSVEEEEVHAEAQRRREFAPIDIDIDIVSGKVVDISVRLHRALGPGLLESVYETVLAGKLIESGLSVERQKSVGIVFEGSTFEAAFRIDLLVENRLVVEIKSIDRLMPVHGKQLLTYLRLMHQPVGLLLNFGGETMKEGIKRVVNNHDPLRLRASA